MRLSAVEKAVNECPNAGRAFNEDGELITLACDRWTCEFCGHVLAWRWAERVRFGIDLARPSDPLFWTLTLPAWVRFPKTGYRLLPDCWARLRQSLRRDLGAFPYCAFVEGQPHRQYIPHFHVIAFQWPTKRLKDLAVHCGFGFEADIQQVSGPKAAAYVSKYASKQGHEMPKGFRRVRVSQDWPKLPEPLYNKCIIYPQSRESLKAYCRRVASTTGVEYSLIVARWLS